MTKYPDINSYTKTDEKTPVLLAYPCEGNQVKAWCPYCKTWHHHGRYKGHRVAHCHTGPFKETGYILKIAAVEPKHAK